MLGGCAVVLPTDCVESATVRYDWSAQVWPSFAPVAAQPDDQGRWRFDRGEILATFERFDAETQAKVMRLGALALELEVLERGDQPAVVQRYLFSFERQASGAWVGYLQPAYPLEAMVLWPGEGTLRVQLVGEALSAWRGQVELMAFEVDYLYEVWSNTTEHRFELRDRAGRAVTQSARQQDDAAVERLLFVGEAGQLGLTSALRMESKITPVKRCQ